MTKKELKSGMLVEISDGSKYMVVLDTGMDNTNTTSNNVLVGVREDGTIGRGWMSLNGYRDDLTYDNNCYNICAVYFPPLAIEIGNFKRYKELWRRGNDVGINYRKFSGNIEVDIGLDFNTKIPLQNIISLNEKITNTMQEWSKEMTDKGVYCDTRLKWSEEIKVGN